MSTLALVLFTYKDGKAVVNGWGVFLLVLAIGFAWSAFRD